MNQSLKNRGWRGLHEWAEFVEKIVSAGPPKVRSGLAIAREARVLPGLETLL